MKTDHNIDLENDIYFALETINGNYKDTVFYNNYCSIDRFTNEPINSYIDYMKDKKDVLSVTGFGDSILKCISYGAVNIDTFDINNLSKYFLDIKLAAAKNLSKNEFFNMFYNLEYLLKNDEDFYIKIRDSLSFNSRIFWDTLLSFN